MIEVQLAQQRIVGRNRGVRHARFTKAAKIKRDDVVARIEAEFRFAANPKRSPFPFRLNQSRASFCLLGCFVDVEQWHDEQFAVAQNVLVDLKVADFVLPSVAQVI